VRRLPRPAQHALHRRSDGGVGLATPGGQRGLQLPPLVRRGAGATLVGHIAHWAGNDQAPFLVAGALVAVGAGLLLLGHRTLGTLHVVPAMAPAMANAD
jgi:hypothetical protein